ncbi:MAG TPA: glucuronate isomerase [Sumerlaeia bacterium]|nr:glucuronate isomerase [Sumerlaeia bacterium]
MTPPFITENFMLENDAAVELFHDYAKNEPIVDYHNHLPAEDLAADRRYENMTRIWLAGDHYKWRLMRANGIDERYCTGAASDWEKFQAWAETVPRLLRNPLYHWTHLELDRYFGITDRLLSSETAQSIWDECNEKLKQDGFSARGLLNRMNVRLICTTDDPTDTLEGHETLAADESFAIQVLPAFRPDKGMAVESPETFNAWVDKLGEAADVEISTMDHYVEALRKRHDFFHEHGCHLSDHGLERIYAEDYSSREVAAIFAELREGKQLELEEILKFKSAMLYIFAVMDHEKGWTQQFHLNAMRNNNTRMVQALGADTGYDSIGDFDTARPLARFLDRLDRANQLAKTILYSLNPRDTYLLATMLGNFQDGSTPGKMQLGSAWWFLDNIDGMTLQIEALSNTGLLSRFVGMLTDSRSFLSFPRHEYFRRLLCNILGADMERGLIPRDMELVGEMVRDVAYRNAVSYFGFDLER